MNPVRNGGITNPPKNTEKIQALTQKPAVSKSLTRSGLRRETIPARDVSPCHSPDPPLTQKFRRDEAPSQPGVAQGVVDRTCGNVPAGIQKVGVVNCSIDDRGGLHCHRLRFAMLLGPALRFALDSALHGAVEGFGTIRRFGMFTSGCRGDGDDLVPA